MYIHYKDKVKLVGDTFDWAIGDGTSPGHQVDQHSDWTNAYQYNRNGHTKKIDTNKQKYATYGRAWHFEPGSLKNDAGGDLQFPCRAGGKNDVDTNVPTQPCGVQFNCTPQHYIKQSLGGSTAV